MREKALGLAPAAKANGAFGRAGVDDVASLQNLQAACSDETPGGGPRALHDIGRDAAFWPEHFSGRL
jgi:hypothetical protein